MASPILRQGAAGLVRTLVAVPVLSLAGFGAVSLFMPAGPAEGVVVEPIPPRTVGLLRLQRESFPHVIERHARLQPIRQWTISMEVSGRVVERPVENGQRVSAGGLLVGLDPEPFLADFTQAEAGIREKEAQRQLADSTLQRARALYQGNNLPREDFERSQADFQRAVASLMAAEADARGARYRRDHCQTFAPADGVVSELEVEVGEFVTPGEPLGIFSQVDRLLVKVLVNWQVRRLVTVGTMATVVDGRSDTYQAILERAADVQSGDSGQFELEFVIDNPSAQLRSGDPVTVRFEAGLATDRLRVPRESVFERYGQWRALIAPTPLPKGPFEALSVPIVKGESDPKEGWVEIHRGLDAGDVVLAPNRVAEVREGVLVRPGPAPEAWYPDYARDGAEP